MLVSATLPARQFKDRCRFEVANFPLTSPVLGAGAFSKNKEAETLDTPRPHTSKGLPITMIPRPRPQEDIDVLYRSALAARSERPHYRRRTASRLAQTCQPCRPCRPSRVTPEKAQGFFYSYATVAGILALFCLAVGLATGGVVAVDNADVNGPDELYHRAEGRL